MIHFSKEDGSVTIDFASGPVKVLAPNFGALRRLRADLAKFRREASDTALAWDKEHPAPKPKKKRKPPAKATEEIAAPDEPDDEEPADPIAVARHAEDAFAVVEEANVEASVKWWRLILVGDESFQRLAETPVSENPDEWPAALLYDFRPPLPVLLNGQKYTTEQLMTVMSTPDRVVRHWGEARSRSGPTDSAGTPTN